MTKPVTVKTGQTYRVAREGKPARHIRITRVTGADSHQPRVAYVEVTRTGNKKRSRTTFHRALTFDGKKWVMGDSFELVTLVPWKRRPGASWLEAEKIGKENP